MQEEHNAKTRFTSLSHTTMTITKIATPFFILAFIASLFALAPQPVSAACSYDGYYNSTGRCVNSIPNNWAWSYEYEDRYYEYRDQTLLSLIAHLQDMIRRLEGQLYDDDYDYYYQLSSQRIDVSTRSAVDVTEDEATLRGAVTLSRNEDVEVYFEYGTSRSNLRYETRRKEVDDRGSYNFESEVRGLSDNTTYYFRAVAEDDDGDEEYGSIYTFRTNDNYRYSSNDDEPELNTFDARDIDDESAELRGEVDMNDFRNGLVFFVYGEDEEQVEDVADDYTRYSQIDEDGDDLQKVTVDNDLDSSASYSEDVDGLDPDTDIYYSICVEYEDDDDDSVISCGEIESFDTDEE